MPHAALALSPDPIPASGAVVANPRQPLASCNPLRYQSLANHPVPAVSWTPGGPQGRSHFAPWALENKIVNTPAISAAEQRRPH